MVSELGGKLERFAWARNATSMEESFATNGLEGAKHASRREGMNGQFIASQAKDPASSSLVSLNRAIAEEMDAVCHEVRWRQNEDERLVEACDEFIDELSEVRHIYRKHGPCGFLQNYCMSMGNMVDWLGLTLTGLV